MRAVGRLGLVEARTLHPINVYAIMLHRLRHRLSWRSLRKMMYRCKMIVQFTDSEHYVCLVANKWIALPFVPHAGMHLCPADWPPTVDDSDEEIDEDCH